MTARKEMYQVLEQMVRDAADSDKEKVLRLNKEYNGLMPRVYPRLPEKLRLEYDNCRNSCVTSASLLIGQYEQLVLDARERFSRLPKPNH